MGLDTDFFAEGFEFPGRSCDLIHIAGVLEGRFVRLFRGGLFLLRLEVVSLLQDQRHGVVAEFRIVQEGRQECRLEGRIDPVQKIEREPPGAALPLRVAHVGLDAATGKVGFEWADSLVTICS